MKNYLITFRSVTFAQRGERLLQKNGIQCTLLRTPKWMEAQGCGYSLRIWAEHVETGVALLRKGNIPLRKVYIQTGEGTLEEYAV